MLRVGMESWHLTRHYRELSRYLEKKSVQKTDIGFTISTTTSRSIQQVLLKGDLCGHSFCSVGYSKVHFFLKEFKKYA